MGFAEGLGLGIVAGLLLAGALLLLVRLRRWSGGDRALLIYAPGETTVAFHDRWVLPIVSRVEEIDLGAKVLEVTRSGAEGLIAKDNIRVDVTCAFTLRINRSEQDVLRVAQALGARRAGDPDALHRLFDAKFSEAMKYVAKQLDFIELFEQRMTFHDAVRKIIGDDLSGFILEDVAVDRMEQTPLDQLDKGNILDAKGMLAVTRQTAAAAQARMEIEREAERAAAKHRRDMEAMRR